MHTSLDDVKVLLYFGAKHPPNRQVYYTKSYVIGLQETEVEEAEFEIDLLKIQLMHFVTIFL